jgi:glycosyltransferase involved in cell wall biosynthesis
MKIALFDPYGYKFSQSIIDYWKSVGYEVKKTLYYDPEWVKWADVTYFETVDNNLQTFSRDCDAGLEHNGKIVAREIDIEAWVGHHNGVNFSHVDDLIFIANHIKRKVEEDVGRITCKTHVIPCGVDTDKFAFNPGSRNKKIAWVAEMWHAKNAELAVIILKELLKRDGGWSLHMLGRDEMESWYKKYFEQLCNGLPITIEERVEDIDSWYEDKSYHLLTSKKEAFSYVTAEAMCKGLKPLVHNFYGARDIWEDYVFDTPSEAVDMFLGDWKPKEYRAYIENKYPLEKMLSGIDKVING